MWASFQPFLKENMSFDLENSWCRKFKEKTLESWQKFKIQVKLKSFFALSTQSRTVHNGVHNALALCTPVAERSSTEGRRGVVPYKRISKRDESRLGTTRND